MVVHISDLPSTMSEKAKLDDVAAILMHNHSGGDQESTVCNQVPLSQVWDSSPASFQDNLALNKSNKCLNLSQDQGSIHETLRMCLMSTYRKRLEKKDSRRNGPEGEMSHETAPVFLTWQFAPHTLQSGWG